ncbi:E3 ubiquitin-protein ligase RNF115 isoform X2 [Pristis pectinata]|uniref:E3 ubiquitin-protein ligase RNF115 isoform X2 n=1 Tax=Pristis pectinata TaxID=685728 RepID=UPI00223D7A4B|nr:E3 ubiquitin-protein ligase RNF115 isoform X2 [Pristis pectinata]
MLPGPLCSSSMLLVVPDSSILQSCASEHYHPASRRTTAPSPGGRGRDVTAGLTTNTWGPTNELAYLADRWSGRSGDVSGSFLDGGTNGLDEDSATQFAELWDRTFLNLDQTFLLVDGRPFRGGTSLDHEGGAAERAGQQSDIWGPSRHTRLPMARRYRSRASSRPERSPAIEGIIQQLFAGLFSNAGIPGSPHTFSCGLLHSNPADYAWGQSGLDAVITQLLGQLENSGPPPADKDKIAALPTVAVSQEQIDSALECPVCKEDYLLAERVRQLPCQHLFHNACIVPWLELHDTCPVCRKSLNGEITTGHQQTSEELAGRESRQRDPWTY